MKVHIIIQRTANPVAAVLELEKFGVSNINDSRADKFGIVTGDFYGDINTLLIFSYVESVEVDGVKHIKER